MNRHDFLRNIHDLTKPRSYVEIGVDTGRGLSITQAPSIGIDPAYTVTAQLATDLQLARTTSDEFFARRDPTAHLPIPIIDLAFVDGMHLAEYALRDYLSIERFSLPTSVIIFDDMLPRDVDQAARYRHTGSWTGDVYKATYALRDQCPDLVVLEVDTEPTGVVVVLTPDSGRHGVLPGYDEWLDVAVTPDPQDVPREVLERTHAWDPERLLASAGWAQLPHLRARSRRATAANVRAAFADILAGHDPPQPASSGPAPEPSRTGGGVFEPPTPAKGHAHG